MLRIGVIGAGRIAQIAHLATLSTVREARIVALADLRLDLAALVAERWNVPALYSSHAELLADPGVDAVVVVTQRNQTAGIARDALRAGKHVLTEKPMALSSADARELVALAGEKQVCYAVGYMKRHDRGVNAARALIAGWRATGRAGKLLLVRATMDGGDDGAGADWLMTQEPRTDAGFVVGDAIGDPTPKSPFDQFLNVFSHTINLARFLTGGSIVLEAAVHGERSAALAGRIADVPFLGAFEDRVVPGWHERIEVIFECGRVSVALPPGGASNDTALSAAEMQPNSSAGRPAELLASTPTTWPFEASFALRERAPVTFGSRCNACT